MRKVLVVLASPAGVGAPGFASAKGGVIHPAGKNGLQGKAEVEAKVSGPDHPGTATKNSTGRYATVANYEEAEKPLIFNAA